MLQEINESKSDSDRLDPPINEASSSRNTTTSTSNITAISTKHNHPNDEIQNRTSYSVNKQQTAATALHQHYLNYFNSNIPKEDTKSQRPRSSISNSLSQHPRVVPTSNLDHSVKNQRNNHITNKANTNNDPNYVYHIPSQNYNHYPSNSQLGNNLRNHPNNMSRSIPRDENLMAHRFQQQHQPPQPSHTHIKYRTNSTGALYPKMPQREQSSYKAAAHNSRHEHQQQRDRDSEETTTTVKEELENDLQACKTSELEAISSLERNLPIELSFLIRQQAHCMARMNYLDRQIRELKDSARSQQQVDPNQVSSTSILNQGHSNRPTSNIVGTATMTHSKNGNFILSDDSGGEYSRATISDDDELSSLLDQIAKSVRPERGSSMINNSYSQLQQQQQQRLAANCSALIGNQHQHPQQPYAIINTNQLHQQQAVPIFVMGSPIAVAHPSSINSNILPGVHFQPEPRYNQYYEDLYYHNGNGAASNGVTSSIITTSAHAIQKHGQPQNGLRSQQFDNSISVIEQLVSQKEKRQIISQLKSADNWLKMRSSNQDGSLRNTTKHQAIAKQVSTEIGPHEVDTLPGDNKTTINGTISSSNMQMGGDRMMVDQIDE